MNELGTVHQAMGGLDQAEATLGYVYNAQRTKFGAKAPQHTGHSLAPRPAKTRTGTISRSLGNLQIHDSTKQEDPWEASPVHDETAVSEGENPFVNR